MLWFWSAVFTLAATMAFRHWRRRVRTRERLLALPPAFVAWSWEEFPDRTRELYRKAWAGGSYPTWTRWAQNPRGLRDISEFWSESQLREAVTLVRQNTGVPREQVDGFALGVEHRIAAARAREQARRSTTPRNTRPRVATAPTKQKAKAPAAPVKRTLWDHLKEDE